MSEMSPHLTGIAAMLAVWAVLFPSIAGLGFLIIRLTTGATNGGKSFQLGLAASFWVGFATLLLILPGIHLIWRIDWKVTYSILALGFIGFVAKLAKSRNWFSQALLLDLAAALPGLVLVASNATLSLAVYDSGLYHLPAIRWANEYPAVPGLGNLHGRLAFNQSSFLFAALLNVPPLAGRAFHVVNSLPVAILTFQVISSVRRLLIRRRTVSERWFHAIILPSLAIQSATWFREGQISSPTPDLGVFVIGMVIVMQAVTLVRHPALAQRQPHRIYLILLCCAAGAMVKLSFAATAGVMFSAAMCLRWRSGPVARDWRILIFITICSLCWILRGIVTSGYPFYPSGLLGLPVDWKIPAASVSDMARVIKGWARQPGPEWQSALSSMDWMRPWWGRLLTEPESKHALILGCGALLGFLARRMCGRTCSASKCGFGGFWILVMPLLAGVCFWFLAAPDPRFLGALPVAVAGWLCATTFWRPRPAFGPIIACGSLTMAYIYLGARSSRSEAVRFDAFGWGKPPRSELSIQRTDSGLAVRIPSSGDQVWDGKLPSAPRLLPQLESRGTKTREGFRFRAESQ